MKNMRIPLLIAHSWSTNLDLMFTVLSAPYLFGPSASGMPLGILGALGVSVKWQSYWGQVSLSIYNNQITLMMSSHGLLNTICTLFIYRPYRDYVIYVITGKKEEGPATVAIGSAVNSTA
uniref:G protein-coupled receptor n=1 Tax=Caenorhabditis tropicalis TaxID=1561998 RepID=A0A1I7UIH9_9PELO